MTYHSGVRTESIGLPGKVVPYVAEHSHAVLTLSYPGGDFKLMLTGLPQIGIAVNVWHWVMRQLLVICGSLSVVSRRESLIGLSHNPSASQNPVLHVNLQCCFQNLY